MRLINKIFLCLSYSITLSILKPSISCAQYAISEGDQAQLKQFAVDFTNETTELVKEALVNLQDLGSPPARDPVPIDPDRYFDFEDGLIDYIDDALDLLSDLVSNTDQLVAERTDDIEEFVIERVGSDRTLASFTNLKLSAERGIFEYCQADVVKRPIAEVAQLLNQVSQYFVQDNLLSLYGHQAEVIDAQRAIADLKRLNGIP